MEVYLTQRICYEHINLCSTEFAHFYPFCPIGAPLATPLVNTKKIMFLFQTVSSACAMAKHRKANNIQVEDVQVQKFS